jgi:hypothetical protein
MTRDRIGYLFVGACLFAAVLPVLQVRADSRRGPDTAVRPGLEATLRVAAQTLAATHLRDRPLTQQPLTALEARFAADFPGAIARYRAGDAIVIVREVTQPTRRLHPAADCFRAAGYALGAARTHADARRTRWNCFEARQGAQRVRVCEHIADGAGGQWTDVSSWYWSALWAQRTARPGPWWAITIVTPIDPEEST